MRHEAAEIRNIVTQILGSIADVSVEDQHVKSVIRVSIKKTGKVIDRVFEHGLGYSATARAWAQNILTTYGPAAL
jgi:hypothetical protein